MNINQSEIWLVEFNPSKGNEIQKTRPAVVINDNRFERFGLKIVIPITEWKEHYLDLPWIIRVDKSNENGLKKQSAFECFQIKSFSEERFVKKIGQVDNATLLKIHSTVTKILNPTYTLQ